MWAEWHNAMFQRAERLPQLSEVLKRPQKKQEEPEAVGDEHVEMSYALMNALMNMKPKKRRQPPASNTEGPAKAAG